MSRTTDPMSRTTDPPAPPAITPDRAGARWAYVAGGIGAASNALLVGFFALAPTLGTDNALGPANDIVGSVGTACMIPAALAVGRHLPDRGPLRVLHRATLGGLGVATLAGPLLVSGTLPFAVTTAASGLAYTALVAWIGVGSRWLERAALLPPRTAHLGQACAWAALGAAGAAVAGVLVPEQSVTRDGLLAVAVAAGAASFLAVPVWWVLVGRWLGASPSAQAQSLQVQVINRGR